MTIREGAQVGEFLGALTSSLEGVSSCEFLEIHVPASVENRPGASPKLKELVQEVRRVVSDGDSFTETLMKLGAEAGAADDVLNVAQFHQPLAAAVRRHSLAPSVIGTRLVRDICESLAADTMLVVTSRVETEGGIRHIPMADFKIHASPDHAPSAVAVARRLGPGYLLLSGSSYHYYGRRLLTEPELREWLLRAQLLSRYVDTRWVTHQLLEGRCALRVSAGGGRQAEPVVFTAV